MNGINNNRNGQLMRRPFGTRAVRRDGGRALRIARDGVPLRRMFARDVAPGVTTLNTLPAANSLTSFGWMGQALGMMGNSARWAVSLNNDNEVIVPTGYPLATLATSPAALLNSALIACAGNGIKNYSSIAIVAPTTLTPQTMNLSTPATQVFGVRVRISNALTTFKFATYEIMVCTAATIASAQSYILVQVASLPVDIIILAITNTAGQATVIPNFTPYVVMPFANPATSPGVPGNINWGSFAVGDVVYAETLNMRDIGSIEAAVSSGAIVI